MPNKNIKKNPNIKRGCCKLRESICGSPFLFLYLMSCLICFLFAPMDCCIGAVFYKLTNSRPPMHTAMPAIWRGPMCSL